MQEDPRRAIVEVMGRLGKETQLHLDERDRHFQITDLVIMVVSFMLVVLASINIYYISVLYVDLGKIVTNMELMYQNLVNVDEDMGGITQTVDLFDMHIQHMQPIHDHMGNIAAKMPSIRDHMDKISGNMSLIEQDMGMLSSSMGSIDMRILQMKSGMSVMRINMQQMANPMSILNPMMP